MLARFGLLLSAAAAALALAGCSDLGRPVLFVPRGDLSATSLDFGTVAVSGFATRTVTLRNSGNADLAGDATVSCGQFRVVTGGGPFRLVPGATLDIVLRFEPVAEGAFSCTLDLGQGGLHTTLVGAGALQPPGAACAVSPGTIDFGVVPVGQGNLRTFKIRSVGTAPLFVNVVSPCPVFLPISGAGAGAIAPGDSITVTVLFNPLAGGAASCAIAVGPGCPDVEVTGHATSVSFSRDVQSVLQNNCSCHYFPYSEIVNVVSYPFDPAVRIAPGDTVNSVIYGLATASGRFGPPNISYDRMPPGTTIPRDQIEKLKTWILEGALNN